MHIMVHLIVMFQYVMFNSNHEFARLQCFGVPHCKCDARKNGHIIVSVNSTGISLRACSEDGVKEVM